ncbi:MAG: cation:proton antiporter [Methylococcaceae bacterium]|jgi:Na+/H+ antiporter
MNTLLAQFAILLLTATLTSVLMRERGWSNLLPLIVLGAVLGQLPISHQTTLAPDMIMVFFLVPLVFGDAITTSLRELRKNGLDILALALFPVIASTLMVGLAARWLTGMPWPLAFALGAILSPTDTVALGSLTKATPLPRQLRTIMEGEALLNDVSGLTALHLSTLALLAGQISTSEAARVFLEAHLVGLGVGLLGGWLMTRMIKASHDEIACNSLTMVVPFGVYAVADYFDGSGILAIVCTALAIGQAQNKHTAFGGRVQTVAIWEHLGFILQSTAFLLMGIELPNILIRLPDAELGILLGLSLTVLLALILARFFTLLVLRALLVKLRPRIPIPWRSTLLVSWFGVRGPVSSMAAFTLPMTFNSGELIPYRDLAVASAFLVIVVTVMLSHTLKPLIATLGIIEEDDHNRRELEVLDRVMTAVLDLIDQWINTAQTRDTGGAELNILQHARTEYSYRKARYRDLLAGIDDASRTLNSLENNGTDRPFVYDAIHSDLAVKLALAEREALVTMEHPYEIPDEVVRKILRDTDTRLQLLNNLIRRA